ncbi:hypothetical protein B0H13DRAFT_1879164 [Mycena leptocephala]|nr:hypothetical protein B0H13DRAFT_1879164 [Mycena leptocephala]
MSNDSLPTGCSASNFVGATAHTPINATTSFVGCWVGVPSVLQTEINVIGQSKQHLPKPTVFAAVRAICIGSRSAAEFGWEGVIDVQVAPSIPMSRMWGFTTRATEAEAGQASTWYRNEDGVGGAAEVYDARSRLIAGVAVRNNYPRLIFRSEIKGQQHPPKKLEILHGQKKPNSTGCGHCTSCFYPPDKPSEA